MDSFYQLMLQTRARVEAGADLGTLVHAVAELMDQYMSDQGCHWQSWAQPGEYLEEVVYDDPPTGFTAVLMTWGPGACTPIHEHGTWSVFGICEESLEITNYMQQEEGRLEPVASFTAVKGDVTWLLPPDQIFHKVHNVGQKIARSLHIYGRTVPED